MLILLVIWYCVCWLSILILHSISDCIIPWFGLAARAPSMNIVCIFFFRSPSLCTSCLIMCCIFFYLERHLHTHWMHINIKYMQFEIEFLLMFYKDLPHKQKRYKWRETFERVEKAANKRAINLFLFYEEICTHTGILYGNPFWNIVTSPFELISPNYCRMYDVLVLSDAILYCCSFFIVCEAHHFSFVETVNACCYCWYYDKPYFRLEFLGHFWSTIEIYMFAVCTLSSILF